MTVAERTIYVGILFLLFTLFSQNPFIGTLGFIIVLLAAFGSTFIIRDSSHLLNYEFGNFFYVLLTIAVIYSVFVHLPSDNITSICIISAIFISTFIVHVVICRMNNMGLYNISDIRTAKTVDEGDDPEELGSPEKTAQGYVNEGETDTEEEDSEEESSDGETDIEDENSDEGTSGEESVSAESDPDRESTGK